MKRFILIFGVLTAGCSDDIRIPTDNADSNGPTTAEGGQAGVDENFNCVGAASGSFANVFVPAGRTCHLSRSTVSGNVLAREGSRLFVSDTRVQGNIDGVEARVVQVRGGSLGGSIQIQEGSSAGEVGASVTGGTVLSQGNITIQKMTTGTIRIADVVGDISVATSNAKVKTHCTCGRLRARSSNGKIELEEHRGSVDASTSNGMIHCELGELGSEGVILATSNGRICLDLPDQVDGDVDIRVDNGVIRTEREVGGVDPEDTSGRVKGTLGRGGVPIRLRASNGTISVR